ncbi:unnamed protein product [Prunus armeniaca]|uniref:Aldehyde dehydrogenase domain-containing protein n=1 Tax=Prunus armeniaca TaxID=36596 RepID=A0A6J5W4K2_PRUAR|nr:unnamed protein product [Prunus armeniaca]
MAFWWPLLVLGFAYAICKFLFMLIPPNVPPSKSMLLMVPPRGRTPQADTKVQCYEPATMKYLGYFPALTPDEVKERVAQARKAQKIWAKSSFKQRRQFLGFF